MGLDYIPHQGRSFLGVTKSFVTSGARSNKQTNKQTRLQLYCMSYVNEILHGFLNF